MALPEGQIIFIPSEVSNTMIVDYFRRNRIYPTTGNDEYIELSLEDMINITQKLNYRLELGPTAFYGVRIPNLKGDLTLQINYSDIGEENTNIHVEQSLDGVNYTIIAGSEITLDTTKNSHTYNFSGLLTNYVRVVVDLCSEGRIIEIIYRV